MHTRARAPKLRCQRTLGRPNARRAPFFRRINVVVVGIRPQCPTYWLACACAVRVIHRGQRTDAPRLLPQNALERKNKNRVFPFSPKTFYLYRRRRRLAPAKVITVCNAAVAWAWEDRPSVGCVNVWFFQRQQTSVFGIAPDEPWCPGCVIATRFPHVNQPCTF